MTLDGRLIGPRGALNGSRGGPFLWGEGAGVHSSSRLVFPSRKSRVGAFLTPDVACITRWTRYQNYQGPCMHQLSEAEAVNGIAGTDKTFVNTPVYAGLGGLSTLLKMYSH